jgi:AcrR family transcriptional regulator
LARTRNEEWYAANKDAILQKAALLFRTHGYDKTTMDDIAGELQLTKASIYYYFPTKDDLLYQVCENAVGQALEQMSEIQAHDTSDIEKLHQLILNHFKAFAAHADAFSVFIQELWKRDDERSRSIRRKQRMFQEGIEALVASAQSSGNFRGSNPALVTFAILGMCHWAYQWMPHSKLSPEEIASGFTDLLANGLLPGPHNDDSRSD